MKTKEEVLQNCTVDGLVVKLPSQALDSKLYQDVAKSLKLIGGKWKGGKVYGFVFPTDPTELLSQIANGDKRNLKKEYQFFATPDEIANWLADLASLDVNDLVLEPSAGQGAIIKAIQKRNVIKPVSYCELMEINQTFLSKLDNVDMLCSDFLLIKEGSPLRFDKIVANPPFSKNQDIDHIRKMYELLEVDGRIVSVASKHWQQCSNKKENEFREWLKYINAEIIEIPKGAFKESGTMISSCVIIINK